MRPSNLRIAHPVNSETPDTNAERESRLTESAAGLFWPPRDLQGFIHRACDHEGESLLSAPNWTAADMHTVEAALANAGLDLEAYVEPFVVDGVPTHPAGPCDADFDRRFDAAMAALPRSLRAGIEPSPLHAVESQRVPHEGARRAMDRRRS